MPPEYFYQYYCFHSEISIFLTVIFVLERKAVKDKNDQNKGMPDL